MKKVKAALAKKLAYEKTDEEIDIDVNADVKHKLAPKRLEPKEKIDPAKVKKLLENLKRAPEQLLSDYDRSITKSHEEHV